MLKKKRFFNTIVKVILSWKFTYNSYFRINDKIMSIYLFILLNKKYWTKMIKDVLFITKEIFPKVLEKKKNQNEPKKFICL